MRLLPPLTEYHTTAHGGDGMDGRSPREVFDACLVKRRVMSEDLANLLLMKKTRPMKVQRNGVVYKGIHYGGRELAAELGKQVVLRIDDRDVTRVDVYSFPADKFITSAASNQRLPFLTNSQALREAMADKKRTLKTVRDYHTARPRMSDSLEDQLARKAARLRQQAAAQPELGAGASISPVRSPLEDQLPRIRRAKGKDAFSGDSLMRIMAARRGSGSEGDRPRSDPMLSYKSAAFNNEDDEPEISRMAVGAESVPIESAGAAMARMMSNRKKAEPSEWD
jgi:hypothetical protein